MPQISPMKWTILNFLTQSSILQIISFMNSKKNYTINQSKFFMKNNKMCWKW